MPTARTWLACCGRTGTVTAGGVPVVSPDLRPGWWRFRRSGCLADPRYDPIGLVLADRDEVVHGVTALGRVEQWRELPLPVTREHLVNLPTVALDTAEHADRPVGTAALVADRVVGRSEERRVGKEGRSR